MTELELALVDLGRHLDYPPTPDLATAARMRIAARPAPARRPLWPRRRHLVLAFAILAVAIGAAFAVPPARTAILDWLGLKGVTVKRVSTLPEAPVAADLALGERITLEEAQRRVDFDVLVPELLGPPDEVWVAGTGAGGRVALVYLPEEGLPESANTGVGLLLVEQRGAVATELIGKLAGSGTLVEQVSVQGSPGIWIEGRPHVFFYEDPDLGVIDETLRLAGNTLLWENGDLLLRVEASVPKEEALEIAASAR